MASPSQQSASTRPSAKPISVATDITLQPPLSRRGEGPGLLLIVPKNYNGRDLADVHKTLDPEPLQKWAEEGFAVAEVRVEARTEGAAIEHCETAIKALVDLLQRTPYGKVGAVVYDSNQGLGMREIWNSLCRSSQVAAIVTFSPELPAIGSPSPPILIHTTEKLNFPRESDIVNTYEGVSSINFVLPGHPHYQAGPAGVAHTRSVGFLKMHLGGPHFDLEAIWNEHCLFEFEERNVEKTMCTMVEEPYVNHVPTMTGGVGRKALTAFYRDHFIFTNPEDTQLELLSRTTGIDRVIDEFIFSFTHNKVIDWLIPGIPPTGKPVRVPFTSVVNIRGDRLYHEHIAWDQASVLRQLGLLPEYLPFPYPLPDGRIPAKGRRFEYRVPAAGVDTARKLVDESSVVSNEMLGFEIREVDDL